MHTATDNKSNLIQIKNSILLLIIGLLLLWAASWINANIKFEAVSNFSPHELAHLIGFASLTTLFWFFLVSPLEKNLFSINIFLGTFIVLLPVAAYFLWPKEITIAIGYGRIHFLIALLPLYSIALVIVWSLVKSGILSAHSAIWWAVAISWVLSFVWEVVTQPHFEVYGGPPRGSIQWPQVICDALGAALGGWLIYTITGTRKVGTTAYSK